jgi:hypothetical protein
MSNLVIRKRRGTISSMSSLTANSGEVYIRLSTDPHDADQRTTLVVHNGYTAGGVALSREDHVHPVATEMTAGFLSAADKTKLDVLSITGGIQNVLSNTTVVTPPQNTANFSTDFSVVSNVGASRFDFAISQTFRSEMMNDMIAFVVALG